MNGDPITLTSVLVLLAMVVVREVLNFRTKKKNGIKGNNPIDFHTLYSRVGEIHKRMDDGDTFRCIRPALERLEDSFKRFGKTLERIEDKLGNLK